MIRGLVFKLTFLSAVSYGYIIDAVGKPVEASSFYTGMGPGKANDGDTNVAFPNVFHSQVGQPSPAWWRVDLGVEVISPEVKIYFRADYKVRRNGARISLSNTPGSVSSFCETITGAADGSDIADIYEFTCEGRGRYLTVSTETDNGDGVVFDFGEVEVHACSEKTFGPLCDAECNCANGTCDPGTGECFSGCMPGWKSSQCDELVSAADVSIFTKYIPLCEVSVTFTLKPVDVALVAEMEVIELESRIECMQKCDALDLCTSFVYKTPNCTLWRPGSSSLSGMVDMWKRQF